MNKVIHQDELKPFLIDKIDDLIDFFQNNFYGIIVFVEDIKEVYKKSDNVIEDINIIFDNNANKNIRISTVPFDEINKIIELKLLSGSPQVVEIENVEITNVVPLFDFEKLVSLYHLSLLVIKDTSHLEKIFTEKKNSIILFSDDLDYLSELLPEPKKNISQLYEHFFKVDVKNLDVNILYSSSDDINKLLYSNDTDELPLPLAFKIDHTGALSFPIRIKKLDKKAQDKVDNDFDKEYKNVDYSELMKKYENILDELN